MKKVLIVTTPDGFFAQGKMPWSSMDVSKISLLLESVNYDVRIVDYDYLKENLNAINDFIIIYTSSQRAEHKQYIEDIMYLLKDSNLLLPSFESLKAHDNKGFQYLLDKKYNLGLIPCDYLPDISELNTQTSRFPCVYKPAQGASSIGVSIVHNASELSHHINNYMDFSVRDLKKYIKKYIFRSKYNDKWERYLEFGKNRFLVQEYLPSLKHDYKVLIFGEKYYVLKRLVAAGDFRASGSGLFSKEFDSELTIILDSAYEFKNKYQSHIYSLDFCVSEDRAHLIEFQFTHVGPVTLTESECYFIKSDDWEKVNAISNLEDEFTQSILGYLSNNTTPCL